MKIHCAAILALGITADAFSTQSQQRTTSTQLFTSTFEDDDGFVDALKGKSNEEGDGADSEEPASGSSRFKEIMQAAKTGGSGHQIQNPFLNPQPAPAPVAPAGVNLENMSVEDQAALLRQLMAGGGGSGGADPNTPPPAMKEKRTDQAGKPLGRNRDADTIANSADVYFAQLKRDSTVRTLARIRGEDDIADAVMEDDGIKELDNLLVENPYLTGQKKEESTFFEAIPEESLGPFIHAAHSEETTAASTSGIKYKDILKKKRSKQQPVAAAAPVAEPPAPEVAAPQPVVAQAAATPPAPVAEAPQDAEEPVEIPRPAQPTVTSYSDEPRQKLRTFMGLLLKHRGGPGFGSGRLKGPEIDRFETMLGEIMTMLREESMQAAPADVPMMTAPVAAAPQPVASVAATPQPVAPAVAAPAPVSANADLAQVDGAVACIEGATMMYKNSPAQLRESLLGALRAALLGAVNTCSRATGVAEVTAEEIGGSATPGSIAQIDSVIACIDGAVTMYKNSPDTVKPDMLVALRAALVSAIGMCNSVMEGGAVIAAVPPASVSPVTPVIETPPPQPQAVVSSAPSVPSPPEAESAAPVAPEEPEVADESLVAHMGPDANSEVLTKIYNQVKAASGNGSLGLRGDLTSSEASELADSLVEVRKVLMKELNEGIPEVAEEKEQEAPQQVVAEAEPAAKSSVASRYKEMLAKARLEKEGKAVTN